MHEKINHAFVAAFADAVKTFKVGPGNWYAPTVFSNVNHSMELMAEESFGPIIGIQKASGDEEAVQCMNGTHYGLNAGVFTPDSNFQ